MIFAQVDKNDFVWKTGNSKIPFDRFFGLYEVVVRERNLAFMSFDW